MYLNILVIYSRIVYFFKNNNILTCFYISHNEIKYNITITIIFVVNKNHI